MRKLLLISALGFIFLLSCREDTEESFCYECQTRYKGPGDIYCESEITTVCEMTEKTIREYEMELQNEATEITGEVCEANCIKKIEQ